MPRWLPPRSLAEPRSPRRDSRAVHRVPSGARSLRPLMRARREGFVACLQVPSLQGATGSFVLPCSGVLSTTRGRCPSAQFGRSLSRIIQVERKAYFMPHCFRKVGLAEIWWQFGSRETRSFRSLARRAVWFQHPTPCDIGTGRHR